MEYSSGVKPGSRSKTISISWELIRHANPRPAKSDSEGGANHLFYSSPSFDVHSSLRTPEIEKEQEWF